MDFMRHTKIVRENDPGPGISIATHAREYPREFNIAPHAHGSDQLIYASHGVMEIASGQSLWVLPPHFGLWIPARTTHSVRMPEQVSMRTIYLRPGIHSLWTSCTVFHVTPLLREILFEIVRIGRIRTRNHLESALQIILVSQLHHASPLPTGVSLPRDSRGLAVAQSVLNDPASHRPFAALCRSAGASVRTIQRIYQREVGQDFETWRRQVRLMKAVQLLISGLTVKEIADAVGYQDSSSFVALFRATFGIPPKSWVSELLSHSSRQRRPPMNTE